MDICYAEPRDYARNCFRENAIHALHAEMTEATFSDLTALGQGSAWRLCRGMWDFLEPKIGRFGAENALYDAVHVINFVVPAIISAGQALREQGRAVMSEEQRLNLVAFFLERMKRHFVARASV